MSLVNTMLEDLDRRHAGSGGAAANALGFLAPPPPRPRSSTWRTALLVLALLVLALLAWRYAPLVTERVTRSAPAEPVLAPPAAIESAVPDRAAAAVAPIRVDAAVPAAPAAVVSDRPQLEAAAEEPRSAPPVTTAEPVAAVDAPPVTPTVIATAPADAGAFERSSDALQERRRAIRDLLQAQRFEAARFELENARAEWPDDRNLAQLEVRALLGLRRDAQALAAAEALNTAARDVTALELLAVARQRNGLHPEAASAWASLTRLDEGRGDWWFGLAVSLDAAADAPRAVTAYQRALRGGELEPALREYARERLVQLAAGR